MSRKSAATRIALTVAIAVAMVVVILNLGDGGDSELPEALPDTSTTTPETTTSVDVTSSSVTSVVTTTVTPEFMDPFDVELSLDESSASSEVIGYDGGVITASGSDGTTYTLDVPEGALLTPTAITVTPVSSIAGSPFDDATLAVVNLAPDGLPLSRAATLTMTTAKPLPADFFTFGFLSSGKAVHLTPSESKGSSVSMEVWHFSGGGAAEGDPFQVDPAAYQPTSQELAKRQELRALVQQCEGSLDPACLASVTSQAGELLHEMYIMQGGIREGLAAAESDPLEGFPDDFLRVQRAMSRMLNWCSDFSLTFGDTCLGELPPGFELLDGDVDDALARGNRAVEQAVLRAYEHCTGKQIGALTIFHSIRAQFDLGTDLVAYQLRFGQLGFDETLTVGEQRNRCARVRLRDAQVPTHTNAGQPGVPVKFRLGLQFLGTGGITRYDRSEDIDMGLSATNATLASSSLSDDDGDSWYETTLFLGEDGEAQLTAVFGSSDWSLRNRQASWTIRPKTTMFVEGKPASSGAYGESVGLDPFDQATIRATVTSDGEPANNQEVTFVLDGTGSIVGAGDDNTLTVVTDADGFAFVTFTAPEIPGTATIDATHTNVDGKTFEDSVSVSWGSKVSISPVGALVDTGGTVDFTATTWGLDPAKVEWTATCGTFDSTDDLSATWRAPGQAVACNVTATSAANSGESATATVNVEESGGQQGQFSEGFFYGREQHECEYDPSWAPSEGHTCEDEIADLQQINGTWTADYAAWIQIHNDGGVMRMDLAFRRHFACGWSYPNGYQTCTLVTYPHWRYRAAWYWQERTITSTGPTSTVAAVPKFSHPTNLLCYIGCLTPSDLNLAGFKPGEMQLVFGPTSVVLISNPDGALWQQTRWIFVKGSERDPFGSWVFHPDALETPEEYRTFE